MKIFTRKFFIVISLVVILALGFFYYRKASANGNVAKFNPKTDTTVKPTRRDFVDELTLAGSIDAQKAELRFQTSGRLSWVGVKVGDKVKRFQALASLDRRELQKSLEREFNDYKSGLLTFQDTQDEYKTIRENNNLTDEMKRILERSQGTLNNAVISYELAEIALRYATLSTPIAGVVTAIDQPYAGINVTPATSAFTVVDPNQIFFRSSIDQEDVPRVKIDQPANITLDSYPDDTLSTKIGYIAMTPVAGEASTVYEIRFPLTVNNSDNRFRIGMDGDVSIKLGESQNALVIPLAAVLQEDDQSYVLVKTADGKTERKNIETGIESDDDIEVVSGLNGDEDIIIKK